MAAPRESKSVSVSLPLYLGHDPTTATSLRKQMLDFCTSFEKQLNAVIQTRYALLSEDECCGILIAARFPNLSAKQGRDAVMKQYGGQKGEQPLRQTLLGCLRYDAAEEHLAPKADYCASRLFGRGSPYHTEVSRLHEQGAWLSSIRGPLSLGFALGMNSKEDVARCLERREITRWIYLPETDAKTLDTVCSRTMWLLDSDKLSARCANPRSVLTHHKRAKERCPGCKNSAKHREHFERWNNEIKASDRKNSLYQVLRQFDDTQAQNRAASSDASGTDASGPSATAAGAAADRELAWTQYRTQRAMIWDFLQEAASETSDGKGVDTVRLHRLARMPKEMTSAIAPNAEVKPLSFWTCTARCRAWFCLRGRDRSTQRPG